MPPSQVAPLTKADRVRAIADGILDLPSLPMVVSKIVELVDNPKTNAATLSRLIATDPGLTARMLKLANSAFYGFPRRIGTINLAIVVLGFNTVKDLGVSSSLVDRFNISHEVTGFDMTGFWEHSIGTAIAARMISREGNYRVVGEAFVTGLLHDIGRLVIVRYLPQEFTEIQRLQEKKDYLLWEAEKEILGLCHAEIGGLLTRRWNLPEQIVDAIRYHHQPLLEEELSQLTAITYFADFLTRRLHPHYAQEGKIWGVAEPVANLLQLHRTPQGEVDIDHYTDLFREEFERANAFRSIIQGRDVPESDYYAWGSENRTGNS